MERDEKNFFDSEYSWIVFLTSCGTSSLSTANLSNDNINITNISDNHREISGAADLENELIKPTPLHSDNQVLTPMQSLKAVLLNETVFLCTDKMMYDNIVHQWNGFLNELTYGNKQTITPQFAVVDLDGDNVLDVVLAIENYTGFVILRYKDGKVYGNIVSYRAMMSLKTDGSFMSSGGASDNSIGKMLFIGDVFFLDEKIRSVGGANIDLYYIRDNSIDKDIWEECLSLFYRLPDVDWHDYSEEVIEQVLDSPVSYEVSISSSDRQNYLDSLTYHRVIFPNTIDISYSSHHYKPYSNFVR